MFISLLYQKLSRVVESQQFVSWLSCSKSWAVSTLFSFSTSKRFIWFLKVFLFIEDICKVVKTTDFYLLQGLLLHNDLVNLVSSFAIGRYPSNKAGLFVFVYKVLTTLRLLIAQKCNIFSSLSFPFSTPNFPPTDGQFWWQAPPTLALNSPMRKYWLLGGNLFISS